MSIRSALGGLPAWPALVIAPLVILVVGALHYGPVYRQCTRLAEARDAFTAAVTGAAREDDATLRLGRLAAAREWDQVRILQDLQDLPAEGQVLDCPFGWDLDAIERRAMIAEGRLGILAFAKLDEVIDYIEFRADEARFEGADQVLARGEAVFTVEGPNGAGGPYTLRPAARSP